MNKYRAASHTPVATAAANAVVVVIVIASHKMLQKYSHTQLRVIAITAAAAANAVVTIVSAVG